MTLEVIRKLNISKFLLSISAFLSLLIIVPITSQALSTESSVLIYQLQTGGSGNPSQEYISIFNNSDEPQEITNWCINYISASGASTSKLYCFDPPNNRTKLFISPKGYFVIATNEFLQARPGYVPDSIFTAGTSGTSGHIKIINQQQETVDTLGWGSASQPESVPAPAPGTGKILLRKSSEDTKLVDTNVNKQDFTSADLVTMTTGHIYEEQIELPIYDKSPILNEIFPNPEGADSGKEFIELHNPFYEEINISGYSLAVGPDFKKSYVFPQGTSIYPKGYHSVSDMDSGLILSNTSGSVRLLNPNEEIVDESELYYNLDENQSWAYNGQGWVKTYLPTRSLINQYAGDKPCPEGQLRSPETGYCRNISQLISTKAASQCKAGEEKNPLTNRCKKIVSITQAACKPGQSRNPATGRCRNASTAQALKQCPAGQERNPITNRCRKSSTSSAPPAEVEDVASPLIKNSLKWWFAGTTAAGSLSYAAYEWRKEAKKFLSMLMNRLSKG